MTQVFSETGDFCAYHKAEEWVAAQGYSSGSMCGDLPIGLMRGDYCIAKWRNLTTRERRACHGQITSPDFRKGPVTVEIFEP